MDESRDGTSSSLPGTASSRGCAGGDVPSTKEDQRSCGRHRGGRRRRRGRGRRPAQRMVSCSLCTLYTPKGTAEGQDKREMYRGTAGQGGGQRPAAHGASRRSDGDGARRRQHAAAAVPLNVHKRAEVRRDGARLARRRRQLPRRDDGGAARLDVVQAQQVPPQRALLAIRHVAQ
jgi:hypothetical protein